MSAAVERVARAIYPHVEWAYRWPPTNGYDGLNEHAKATLADLARAAIAALREPDEAMLTAGTVAGQGIGISQREREATSPAARVWSAMLDEALRPDAPPAGKEGGYSAVGPVARPDGGG